MLVDLVEDFANNLNDTFHYRKNNNKHERKPFINCENSSGHVLGIGRAYLLVAIPNATCI
jgi:hypothetical protein